MQCLNCGSETKNPKFCSRKCSSIINNSLYPKRGNGEHRECKFCGRLTKNAVFCSTKCANDSKKQDTAKRWLEHGEGDPKNPTIRKIMLDEQAGVCSICSQSTIWNDKPLSLILDHIDGNAENNSRDNLRLVCHNCDSQLDTYKSRNIGKGRFYRRQRYADGKSY